MPRSLILRLLALVLLVLPALPAPAKSDKDRCEIDINRIDRIEPVSEYDPYAGGSVGYHEIELEHDDGDECTLIIGIDEGGNGNRILDSSKGNLAYDLYMDARLSQRVYDLGGPESGLFTVTMSEKNDDVSLQFFSYIEPGQLVPKGTYSDQVTVNVYELRDGAPFGPIASRTAQVRTKVRSVVSASVVVNGVSRPLSGSVGVLDMGDLTRGGTGRFDLQVSGNDDYSLSLSSENAGRLISSDSPEGIGYQLYVSGRAVSLGKGSTVDLGGEGRYELRVETSAAGNALAGTYHDNLILTISAQ